MNQNFIVFHNSRQNQIHSNVRVSGVLIIVIVSAFFFVMPILLARNDDKLSIKLSEKKELFMGIFFLFIQICSLLCAHTGDENDIPLHIRFETIVSLSF